MSLCKSWGSPSELLMWYGCNQYYWHQSWLSGETLIFFQLCRSCICDTWWLISTVIGRFLFCFVFLPILWRLCQTHFFPWSDCTSNWSKLFSDLFLLLFLTDIYLSCLNRIIASGLTDADLYILVVAVATVLNLFLFNFYFKNNNIC